jgi:hypothetical protein
MASKKRKRAQKMADRGASADKIVSKTGVSEEAAERFVSKAAAESTASASTSTTPEIKGVKQGLKILGAGGISAGDLKTIRKATGVSDEKLIRKLDKVNKKLKEKDKTGISINSGAVNKIIKRGVKRRSKGPLGAATLDFGTGRIGLTIAEMMGTSGSPGVMIKGERVGASDAVEPKLLTGGMQIRPGGREREQGFGKQYELPERFKSKDEVVDNTTGTVTDTVTDIVDDGPGIPEEVKSDTSPYNGFGDFDLASWATGFKRARSSRQRAGRRAQGIGQMKKDLKFKPQF